MRAASSISPRLVTHANQIAGLDLEALQMSRVPHAPPFRFQRVQHTGPARVIELGMPMFEQAARRQHNRKRLVWCVVGGQHVSPVSFRPRPVGVGKLLAENDILALACLVRAGIGHGILGLKPGPGNAKSARASPAASRQKYRAHGRSSSSDPCGWRFPE